MDSLTSWFLALCCVVAAYVYFFGKGGGPGAQGLQQEGGASERADAGAFKLASSGAGAVDSAEYVRGLMTKLRLQKNLRVVTVGLSSSAPLSSSEKRVLADLAGHMNVFLSVSVPKEGDAMAMRDSLELEYPMLPPHRLLMHSTDVGGLAVLRQLDPHLHVETSGTLLGMASPFLQKIAFITDDLLDLAASPAHVHVLLTPSLHELFALPASTAAGGSGGGGSTSKKLDGQRKQSLVTLMSDAHNTNTPRVQMSLLDLKKAFM